MRVIQFEPLACLGKEADASQHAKENKVNEWPRMKTFPLVYNPLSQEEVRAMTPFPIWACLRTIPVLVSKQVVGTCTHVIGTCATTTWIGKQIRLGRKFQQEYKDMILRIKPWEPKQLWTGWRCLTLGQSTRLHTIHAHHKHCHIIVILNTPPTKSIKYTDTSGVIRRGEANQTKALLS